MFDTKCRICKFCPATRYLNVRNLFLVLLYLRKIFSENIQDFLAPPQLWYVPQERGGLGRLSSGGLGGQLLLLRAGDLAQVRPLQQHLHLQQGSTPAAPGPCTSPAPAQEHHLIHRPDTYCYPFIVKVDPVVGRYVVAARDIAPCEPVLRELPAGEGSAGNRGPRSCLENAPNVTFSLLKALSHIGIY